MAALKPCKKCGREISKTAKACPGCGHTKGGGCMKAALVVFLAFIGLAGLGAWLEKQEAASGQDGGSGNPISRKSATQSKEHREGETVSIGYTSYQVTRSYWTQSLPGDSFGQFSPNSSYLVVELVVRNDDKKARMVPPLKLISREGYENEASSNGIFAEGAISILEELNPGVTKSGPLIFDVLKKDGYKLKVSGGYWSGEDAMVALSPENSN